MDIVKMVQEKMAQNTYLVVDGEDAILIDAGVFVSDIEAHLKVFSSKPHLRAVFLTHCHFDHIQELDNIVKKYGCPVYIFKAGKTMLYSEEQNLSFLDKPFKIKERKLVKTFKDGEEFEFGAIKLTAYNTPGHSIDSSVFVVGDNMFTGDTVFRVEVGRTDLYSGDESVQRISLERILNTLSTGVENFFAGHGSNFTSEELKYNITRILGDN